MKGKTIVFALAGSVALAGCAGGTQAGGASASKTSAISSSSSTSSSSSSSSQEVPKYQPKPSDFTIAVKIREKECFGSAGCNITYRINPSYDGPVIEGDWSVTYEVLGGDDGPQINTFTFDGSQASLDSEEYISTSSSKKKLTARATDVSEE